MTYFLVLIDTIGGGGVVVFDDGSRSSFSCIFEGDFVDVRVSLVTDGAGRMSSLGSSVSVDAYALPGKSNFGLSALVGKGSPGSTPSESSQNRSSVNAEDRDTFSITLQGGHQNEHEKKTMHDDCQPYVWQ
jgi:hypothetical protein